MSKVSIPDPCSEDWNEMSPTERGAFCQKCQIDVVDFTYKSPNEIKTILMDNRGKHLCAHIKKSQIEQLNLDYAIWENQSVRTFHSKFLWACIMVFGMSLFTACNSAPEEEQYDVGMVEYVPDSTDQDDPIINGGMCVEPTDSTDDFDYCDDVLIDGLMEVDESYYDSIEG